MDEGKVSTPTNKPHILEAKTVSPVQLYDLPRENVAKSSSKELPSREEKEHLCRQTTGSLTGTDELDMPRRQVELRDFEKPSAYVTDCCTRRIVRIRVD
jgi:hypothetical protein